MKTKKDIESLDDIKILVNDFYDKAKQDELLAPVFFSRITGDWQPHLEKMYLFWNAALFSEKGYVGNPFSKHATLKISPAHFERWLLLFTQTIDKHFSGNMANDAKWRASVMADNFMRRLASIQQDGTRTLV